MCGIAGYISFKHNFYTEPQKSRAIARNMGRALKSRGPDGSGEWIGENAVFSNSRLAVIDPTGGAQPMSRTVAGYEFVITYDGALYNAREIKAELIRYGYRFTTDSDTETLLYAYIHYGAECAQKLNGIYAFCVWDAMRQRVFLCRDRLGVKPLFYSFLDDTLIFGSEIKALLAYPGMEAKVSVDGLCEIFALNPARTQGHGVFYNIQELCPGRYLTMTRSGMKIRQYWTLESHEHTDSFPDTVQKVHDLVTDSIKRQLVCDVPISSLLCGDINSSIVSAVAATEYQKWGKRFCTYSFDYKNNDPYVKAPAFQPESGAPWIKRMIQAFDTSHIFLECNNSDLTDLLEECVVARDLPGIADVDASLLYFYREIKKHHTVILSGECADDIFGAYPWFHSPDAFQTPGFPWAYDLSLRKSVLLPAVRRSIDLDAYAFMRYEQSLAEAPAFEGDSPQEKRRREIAWLHLNWFMAQLLERKDRISMASGLEVRVPFCDYRLVEYMWNVPWEFKNKNNISNSLLREAVRDILPPDVLYRKKALSPQMHNPLYEKKIKSMMLDTISDPNAPILALCDYEKIVDICMDNFSYGKPFFGQLMAGHQFIGYLLQINYWLKDYKIRIV